MVEGSCVFDSLKRLGVAGRPLEKNEEREVAKMAEVAKVLMEESVYDLLKNSQHKLVLYDYSGDSTPQIEACISGGFCRAPFACSRWVHWL